MAETHKLRYETQTKTVLELIGLFTDRRLNLEPGFQRDSVWNDKDRQKLIESILSNYPLPSIYLRKRREDGEVIYDVIDGKQRIESILRFTGEIKGGIFSAPLPSKDGRTHESVSWKNLIKRQMQYLIHEFKIQTIEVEGEFNEVVNLFVLINSTGQALSRQETRNAKFLKSELLRAAKQLASKYESFLRDAAVLSAQQIRRMKHIELLLELLISASTQDVVHKKTVLDGVMKGDTIKGASLKKATSATISGLNRLRKMFPDLGSSVRFHKLSDFYSLAVLVQKFEREKRVLSDGRRNRLAWDVLVAFGRSCDHVSEASKKMDFKARTPEEELCRDYLQTVKEGTDHIENRKKREQILRGLLESLFQVKDSARLFSEEQRRILWNSTEVRICSNVACAKELTWSDLTIDHVKPWTKGGRTELDNAALLCGPCNSKKGSKKSFIAHAG